MPLNILQCPGQPPATKDYLAPNVNSAEAKKPCLDESYTGVFQQGFGLAWQHLIQYSSWNILCFIASEDSYNHLIHISFKLSLKNFQILFLEWHLLSSLHSINILELPCSPKTHSRWDSLWNAVFFRHKTAKPIWIQLSLTPNHMVLGTFFWFPANICMNIHWTEKRQL